MLYLMGACGTDPVLYHQVRKETAETIDWTFWDKATEYFSTLGKPDSTALQAVRDALSDLADDEEGGSRIAEKHGILCKGCDPLLYQYVDGSGFFTSHGQPSKQMRLVRYIYARRYSDHHDDEFIRRCERVRGQFILTSSLCGLVLVSLVGLMIWH